MDPQTPPTPSISSNVRTWCVLCHAAALLGLFFHFPGHILGPLVVWLIKRGDSPEIDAHGKESLNFQISMLIYDGIPAILSFPYLDSYLRRDPRDSMHLRDSNLDSALGAKHRAGHHRSG